MSKLSTHYDRHPWLHYQAALKVARLLNQHKYDAYLIGGAVRDIWLGRLPKDFDLVTNANPNEILALPGLDKAYAIDPALGFGITRVKVKIEFRGNVAESEVEVATYRRDIEAHLGRKDTKVEFANLEEDVLRRDFTINGLALDMTSDFLVDYVSGIDDLEAKMVRFIGDPLQRIKEDPLRIIRAIRFKNQLGFNYAATTSQAISAAVKDGVISRIAPVRLIQELTRLLIGPSRKAALADMLQLGILDKVLPEVAQTVGVAQQPQYHNEGDVWTHTLLALSYLPPELSPRLAWATLLHDIGKPSTAIVSKDKETVEFPSHYEVGARLAEAICARLGFSKQLATDITWMVRYHMGIDDLPKMRPGHRQVFLANPAFNDLLELHKADARASWHINNQGAVDKTPPRFLALEQLAKEHQKLKGTPTPSLKRDLGVDGQWLMKEFDLAPGARLGQILANLNETYLNGELKNQADVKVKVAELLRST